MNNLIRAMLVGAVWGIGIAIVFRERGILDIINIILFTSCFSTFVIVTYKIFEKPE
jgi:hypothetical protein